MDAEIHTQALLNVLDEFERRTKDVPVGHENKERGTSTYNWRMAHLMELRAILDAQDPACPTCGGSRIDPGGLPMCRECSPAMSDIHPALQVDVQAHRNAAYQNGWDDGYAEGFGKASVTMQPECIHPWAFQDQNGVPSCAGCGEDWTNVMHPPAARGTVLENDGLEECGNWSATDPVKREPAPAAKATQDEIERIILRRLHEQRIEGYTLEMAKEIADAMLEARSASLAMGG